MSRAIVAKIEVISSTQSKEQTLTKAKVVDALKGIKKGAVISIRSSGSMLTSCDQDPESVKPFEVYYFAGSIGADGVFQGSWKGDGAFFTLEDQDPVEREEKNSALTPEQDKGNRDFLKSLSDPSRSEKKPKRTQ